MESILTSIKSLLGIGELEEHFDLEIVMHINSVFFILNQLGVGTEDCFSITDKTQLWSAFIANKNFEAVKTYMYLKVRLVFDPPLSASLLQAMKSTADEYEWRLTVSADPPLVEEVAPVVEYPIW